MLVSELEGAQLDYWVARTTRSPVFEMGAAWPGNAAVNAAARDGEVYIRNLVGSMFVESYARGTKPWAPSTDWSQAGEIIDVARIAFMPRDGHWIAGNPSQTISESMRGPTPLIAAMRAYVSSRYGETVPEMVA